MYYPYEQCGCFIELTAEEMTRENTLKHTDGSVSLMGHCAACVEEMLAQDIVPSLPSPAGLGPGHIQTTITHPDDVLTYVKPPYTIPKTIWVDNKEFTHDILTKAMGISGPTHKAVVIKDVNGEDHAFHVPF